MVEAFKTIYKLTQREERAFSLFRHHQWYTLRQAFDRMARAGTLPHWRGVGPLTHNRFDRYMYRLLDMVQHGASVRLPGCPIKMTEPLLVEVMRLSRVRGLDDEEHDAITQETLSSVHATGAVFITRFLKANPGVARALVKSEAFHRYRGYEIFVPGMGEVSAEGVRHASRKLPHYPSSAESLVRRRNRHKRRRGKNKSKDRGK